MQDELEPKLHRLVHDDEQHLVGLVRHRHLRRQELRGLQVPRIGQAIVPLDRLAVDFGLENVGAAVARLSDHGRASPLAGPRSEEHTSELQSLMRISYAVFCLKKQNNLYNK